LGTEIPMPIQRQQSYRSLKRENTKKEAHSRCVLVVHIFLAHYTTKENCTSFIPPLIIIAYLVIISRGAVRLCYGLIDLSITP
jgi:hypothetical protein